MNQLLWVCCFLMLYYLLKQKLNLFVTISVRSWSYEFFSLKTFIRVCTRQCQHLMNFLQDDCEIHYSGFKTLHIHNLSDLVIANLGTQVNIINIALSILFLPATVLSSFSLVALAFRLYKHWIVIFIHSLFSSSFCLG